MDPSRSLALGGPFGGWYRCQVITRHEHGRWRGELAYAKNPRRSLFLRRGPALGQTVRPAPFLPPINMPNPGRVDENFWLSEEFPKGCSRLERLNQSGPRRSGVGMNELLDLDGLTIWTEAIDVFMLETPQTSELPYVRLEGE